MLQIISENNIAGVIYPVEQHDPAIPVVPENVTYQGPERGDAAPAGYEDEISPVPQRLIAEPAEGTAAGYPGPFFPV